MAIPKSKLVVLANQSALFSLTLLFSLFSVVAMSQSYTEKWENGDDKWRVQGGSSIISSNKSVSGSKSFRAYLPAKVSSNPRHEIVWKGTSDLPHNEPLLKTSGVQFAMYVPSNFNTNDHSNEIIMQYHAEQDGHDTYTNPFFALQISDDDFRVITRWIKRDPGTNNDKVETTYNNVAKVIPGKWHYFVVDINWDYRSSGNGYAKVYMRVGSKPSSSNMIVHHNGPIGSKDKIGPYVKFGIYKFDWRQSSYVNAAKEQGITSREYYFDDITLKRGAIIGTSSSSGGTTGDLGLSAGSDFNVPVTDKNFRITATWDNDVNMKSIQWRKISGPSAVENNMDNYRALISSIKEGTYEFEAKLTDTNNTVETDRVRITVYDGAPPADDSGSGGTSSGGLTVSAGADMNVDVDDRNFRLTAEWDDGVNVKSVAWKKISGPSVYESKMNEQRCIISSIKVGEYIYETKIVDNSNNVATDRVKIVVYDGAPPSGGSTGGSSISVSAGPNMTVPVGDKNFRLDASWSSSINVTSVQWTKISGPTVYESKMNEARCIISSIKVGSYVYEVKIVDDENNVGTDRVSINVTSTGSSMFTGSEFDDFVNKEFTMGITRNFITATEGINLIDHPVAQNSRIVLMTISGHTLNSNYNNGFLPTYALSPGIYVYNVVSEEGSLIQKGRIVRK